MKNQVFAAALLMGVASFFCAVRPAAAAPTLWVVQSESSKVYLFGTVHVLRSETPWHSPELDAAIKESQDLYLEIADPTDKAGAMSLLKLGIDREHPLSSKISKDDVALLDKEAKRYGYPGELAFEPMRPWLAFMMLAVLPAMHSGYGTSSGVDLQIRNMFVTAAKPVHGFETADMQAHLFADLPQSTQVALLEMQLKHMSTQTGVPLLDAIVDAWSAGDQDKLATQLKGDEGVQSPLTDALLGNRNKAWATALALRLKQPGTSFVAVGAGHMLGPDGVPALLEKMGFKVTRVQIAQTSAAPSPPIPSASPGSATPVAATPSPAPSPSKAPKAATVKPPAGWKSQKIVLSMGGFTADTSWMSPGGGIVIGHMDTPAAMPMDLDVVAPFFHQGLVAAAGPNAVQPSKLVTICGGKQKGMYTKAKITIGAMKVKEDVLIALTDRVYVAEYVRQVNAKDDPAAIRSLLSLCAP
ncbi:MAG: TraB/GumN family protein [Candidatus Eremiobacteraeota bacterium]|nr:TraB/GumN family protein [Candidatus Eremiobacteraeota bacterium]